MISAPIAEQADELARLTRGSLVTLGTALYPDTFFIKPSPLHHSLSEALVGSDDSTVLAFPREFGKTTYVWDAFASWNVLHRKYTYVMYIGATLQIAKDQLMNVKNAIITHPILANSISIVRNTQEQFFYQIGKKRYFITCHGAGQMLRGKRFEKSRPDIVVIDDIETTEGVRSKEQRKKLKDWFFADVIPLGKMARFFYVGTMLHEDCLLANLIQQPLDDDRTNSKWKTFRYGVIDDETGNPTWPDKYDEAWIETRRKSYIANNMLYRFNTEYMNIAVAREDRVFDPGRIRFYNPEQLKAAQNGGMDTITIVDPGIHPDGDHDPTVILTTQMDSLGQIWVLNVSRKHMVHHEILDEIVEEYKKFNPNTVYIESVQGQEYLAQDLEDGKWQGGHILPIQRIDGKQIRMGKLRIYGLEGLFQQRKLLVPASASWWVDMCDELVSFPRGRHDDILDCLAYSKMNHTSPGAYKINVEELLNATSSTVF